MGLAEMEAAHCADAYHIIINLHIFSGLPLDRERQCPVTWRASLELSASVQYILQSVCLPE